MQQGGRMKKESDIIKNTLLLYENIEKLKSINAENIKKVDNNNLKAALNEMIAFNEKLISVIEVYENILFGEMNEYFDKGDQN